MLYFRYSGASRIQRDGSLSYSVCNTTLYVAQNHTGQKILHGKPAIHVLIEQAYPLHIDLT